MTHIFLTVSHACRACLFVILSHTRCACLPQTNCFRAILATTPEDLLPAVYMCVNRVAPAHFGIELGVGESTLIKVRVGFVQGGCFGLLVGLLVG